MSNGIHIDVITTNWISDYFHISLVIQSRKQNHTCIFFTFQLITYLCTKSNNCRTNYEFILQQHIPEQYLNCRMGKDLQNSTTPVSNWQRTFRPEHIIAFWFLLYNRHHHPMQKKTFRQKRVRLGIQRRNKNVKLYVRLELSDNLKIWVIFRPYSSQTRINDYSSSFFFYNRRQIV